MRHFLAALSLGLTFFSAYPTLAQPSPPPPRATITVQGEGHAEAKPDYAAISADIVTTASNLSAAQKAHRERAAKASAALRALEASGLKIESSTFRLDRVNQPASAGQKPVIEFRAVTSFSLKTKNIAAIDEIAGKIAATGLFEIHNLRFALDDNSKALDEARRNAVLDARRRAEIYAEAAGVKLGDVIEISDTERRFPIPMKQAGYAREMAITPPETLDANASVTMTWGIWK
ncbi:MAG TPA: SIMPL domain-containing protein [Xanthobacteraceae bacterium]|nr:SIMPL domain-containing protein [Xanthobacteraceae bacterium]